MNQILRMTGKLYKEKLISPNRLKRVSADNEALSCKVFTVDEIYEVTEDEEMVKLKKRQ